MSSCIDKYYNNVSLNRLLQSAIFSNHCVTQRHPWRNIWQKTSTLITFARVCDVCCLPFHEIRCISYLAIRLRQWIKMERIFISSQTSLNNRPSLFQYTLDCYTERYQVIQAEWRRYAHGLDNGLSPARHQCIIWSIFLCFILSIGSLATHISEFWSKYFSLKKNACENVVCEMSAILFWHQCTNIARTIVSRGTEQLFSEASMWMLWRKLTGTRRIMEWRDVQRTTEPSTAEITKYQHWLSVAISNIDQLHRTLHHASKIQGVMWYPHFY